MSDLRAEMRRRAAALFDSGRGHESVADSLGVPRAAVRKWQLTYRAVGLEGLLNAGGKRAGYDPGTRAAAARAVVDGGLPRSEAMRRFGIASASSPDRWCRLYREGGAEALGPKPKGRPKGPAAPAPRTRERELEGRVRELEAEVAYLKKFRALASRDPR